MGPTDDAYERNLLMGWAKSITLWCDECGDTLDSGDLSTETVAEARRTAREYGGTYRNGRDLCSDCR